MPTLKRNTAGLQPVVKGYNDFKDAETVTPSENVLAAVDDSCCARWARYASDASVLSIHVCQNGIGDPDDRYPDIAPFATLSPGRERPRVHIPETPRDEGEGACEEKDEL